MKKKSGKIRICIDYRKLNAATKLNSYPLPNIEDTLMQFSNTKFFSTLDLLSGYHQIALEPSSMEKTAFATDRGLYEYRVMPQGACNSPATFQNLMNIMLQGMTSRQASAYLDDILVTGQTFEEHLDNLEEVLKRLRAHGLKLSTAKCNLIKDSVPYLGHTLTREGIKTSLANVEAILQLPIPTTVRGLKKLNGMISYYSKFIPNIAVLMQPLYKITSEKKLYWTSECSEALEEVKRLLTRDPVLAYPRYGGEDKFIVTTDASDLGFGAVLSQTQDGIERVIGYGSVTLNKAQKNYSTTEKELAALRFGVRHFKPYIYGRKYVVRTDHKALIYLNQMKNIDHRLMRTFEDLQVGDYEVEFIRGRENVCADLLSRDPLKIISEEDLQEEAPGYEGDPVFTPAGGPNSLFDSLSYAMMEPVPPLQLKQELTQYLLGNLKKYGLETKSKTRKWFSSYGEEEVFSGTELIPVFVDIFLCDVIVYHQQGPRVVYKNRESRTDIILESRGGVHFNLLREETQKDDLNYTEGQVMKITKRLHEIVDDDIVLHSDGDELSHEYDLNHVSTITSGGAKQPMLSDDNVREAIVRIHEDLHHAGIEKTAQMFKRKYPDGVVRRLFKTIKECLRECDVCQRYKIEKKSPNQAPPMFKLDPTRPSEIVALDLLDLGPCTKNLNKTLLVGVDLHTKFGYAIPIRNKTSKTVARAVENGILANSIHLPRSILTDGGPEFKGGPFKNLLDRYNIKHRNSIPYHPQSNGAVERLNKTIKTKLATTVQGNYLTWDTEITHIMVQYNRTIHKETGRTPVSYYSELPEEPVLRELPVRRPAGKNFRVFKKGDLVLRKIPYQPKDARHKLSPIYDGPYVIHEKISDVSYKIKNTKGRVRIVTVHITQIRPYYPPPKMSQGEPTRGDNYSTCKDASDRNSLAVDDPPGRPGGGHTSPILYRKHTEEASQCSVPYRWRTEPLPLEPSNTGTDTQVTQVAGTCRASPSGGVDIRSDKDSTNEGGDDVSEWDDVEGEGSGTHSEGVSDGEVFGDSETEFLNEGSPKIYRHSTRLQSDTKGGLLDESYESLSHRQCESQGEQGGRSPGLPGSGAYSESVDEGGILGDSEVESLNEGGPRVKKHHMRLRSDTRGGLLDDSYESLSHRQCESQGEQGGRSPGLPGSGAYSESVDEGGILGDSEVESLNEGGPRVKKHHMRLRSDTRGGLLDDSYESLSHRQCESQENQDRQSPGLTNPLIQVGRNTLGSPINESNESPRETCEMRPPVRKSLTLTGMFSTDEEIDDFEGFQQEKGEPLISTRKNLLQDIRDIAERNKSIMKNKMGAQGRKVMSEGYQEHGNMEGFEGFSEMAELRNRREMAFQKLKETIQNCNDTIEKVMEHSTDDSCEVRETLRTLMSEMDENVDKLREVDEVVDTSGGTGRQRSGMDVEDWEWTPDSVSINNSSGDREELESVAGSEEVGLPSERLVGGIDGDREMCGASGEEGAFEELEFQEAECCGEGGIKKRNCCRMS